MAWRNFSREDAKRLGIEGQYELMKLEQKLEQEAANENNSKTRSKRDNPEEREQMKLAQYLDWQGYQWCHIPNEGRFNVQYLVKRKRLGVKKGVPDNFIFEPIKYKNKIYIGVVIELKRIEGGQASKEQEIWLKELSTKGWLTKVCHGADAAIKLIESLEFIKGDDFEWTIITK